MAELRDNGHEYIPAPSLDPGSSPALRIALVAIVVLAAAGIALMHSRRSHPGRSGMLKLTMAASQRWSEEDTATTPAPRFVAEPTSVPAASTTSVVPPPPTTRPPTTTAPPAPPATRASAAPPTTVAGRVSAASAQITGYGCDYAIAWLETHSAPGFRFECPGYADGHQAMTCVNIAGLCPGQKVIAIAVPCPAAYMNEAHNSWVESGLRSGAIDPYGYC